MSGVHGFDGAALCVAVETDLLRIHYPEQQQLSNVKSCEHLAMSISQTIRSDGLHPF